MECIKMETTPRQFVEFLCEIQSTRVDMGRESMEDVYDFLMNRAARFVDLARKAEQETSIEAFNKSRDNYIKAAAMLVNLWHFCPKKYKGGK